VALETDDVGIFLVPLLTIAGIFLVPLFIMIGFETSSTSYSDVSSSGLMILDDKFLLI
jgi:hypothetical protein